MCETDSPIQPDSCRFLNFRTAILSKPCPHCHRSGFVRPHGYGRKGGEPAHSCRFFCSNRYTHKGCGRTFSVFWDEVIPRASMRTSKLSLLMDRFAHSGGNSLSSVFRQSQDLLDCSLSTAYRWFRRFRLHQPTIRSALFGLERKLPDRSTGSNVAVTWQWLAESFAGAICPIAGFQSRFQLAFGSSSHTRWPSFYRSPFPPERSSDTATRNEKTKKSMLERLGSLTSKTPSTPEKPGDQGLRSDNNVRCQSHRNLTNRPFSSYCPLLKPTHSSNKADIITLRL